MPTFVVSLYLPYTVDFHDLPTPDRRPSPPLRQGSRNDSQLDLQKTASLFAQPTPPRTPAASADVEDFFSQFQPKAPGSPLISLHPKPHDPRSMLVRSDSHMPEWVQPMLFNQPRSRAGPAPPDTILRYAQAQAQQQEQEKAKPKKRHQRRGTGSKTPKSRELSHDRQKWGQEWTIEAAVQGNGGLANAIRAATNAGELEDVIWFGTLGFPTDTLEDSVKDEIHEKLEAEFDAMTVFVSDSDFDGHYAHYCKTILWPVFHYQIPDHPKSKAYEDHSWKFYVNLNQAFADAIVKCYKRGDKIWINDYHLLLVPAMLRKKLPDAEIGFFLHTAFPSSEVFRCLATRKPLLEGMLAANLVAFQSPEYAEHFLTTCSRLLTVEATHDRVQLDDHAVNVASLPIGIDPAGLGLAREEDEVKEWMDVMLERYKDKKLIVARDKLDNVRGVRQKLLAYELFLNKYPEWRENVVLIQVATSTTENDELAATVSDIVTRIDSQHSTLAHQPLVFLRQDISFSQYLALLSVADCLMITSLREGMNLTVHEFVVCQDGKFGGKKHAPVILSEFTGSASVFKGNELYVNPWGYQQCADTINKALSMDDAEKTRRYSGMQAVVYTQTGAHWTKSLIDHLDEVYEEQYKRDTMSIPRLSISQLSQKYKDSTQRVFLLDYEGTLASTASTANNIILQSPQRVLDGLNEIMFDERNIVYLMSGHSPDELERLFNRVPGLGIIAENGCFVRHFNTDTWTEFADSAKTAEWKESVKNILQYYIERVEGSRIEERRCSLIFHYDKADDIEAASRQAGDCANHINDAASSQRVHAIPVDSCVVIEPIDWSKASAAEHILDKLRSSQPVPDFLMVAGDDRQDESVFRIANNLGDEGAIKHVTTVSVGKRNTEAMATLTQGQTGLLSVLQRLAKLR